MLPRPPYITAANNTQDQHSTTDSELPVSDTSTETESDADFTPFQDHTTYITGPSTRNQPTSNREESYTSKHLTVSSIELHKQSTTRLEDKTTSTPATNIKQKNANQQKQPTHDHPEPTLVRKSPLLPTPQASERISNNTNNYKQHITRPSAFNSSRKSTFARPSEFNHHRFHQQHIPGPSPSPPRYNTYPTLSGPATMNNYSYYLQPHIPGPHTANLPYLHQEFFTRPYQQIPLLPLPSHQIPAFIGPYQQISGHLTPQVYYLPVILLHPLQHYTAWSKKTEDTGYIKTFCYKHFYSTKTVHTWTV